MSKIINAKEDFLQKRERVVATQQRIMSLQAMKEGGMALHALAQSKVLEPQQVDQLVDGVRHQLEVSNQSPSNSSFLNETELEWVKQVIERMESAEKLLKEEEQKLFQKIMEVEQVLKDFVSAGEKDAAFTRMTTVMKQAALLALKRKKMYEAYIYKLAGARNTIDAQLRALQNALTNVKILKQMGEGAEAMKLLNEKTEEIAKEANTYVQEQLKNLKDIEVLAQLQSEDGSFIPNQKFADAVNCSLENMQTNLPDSISGLKEKDKIWTTAIGLGFMLSRFEKMYHKGKELVSKELNDVNGVDVEQLIFNAKELYFADDSGDLEDLEV